MSAPSDADILRVLTQERIDDWSGALFGDRPIVIEACDDPELEEIGYWIAARIGAQFVELSVVGESSALRDLDRGYGNVTRWFAKEPEVGRLGDCIRIKQGLMTLAQEARIFE